MKKYLPVFLLLVLIVPSVALVSWWNPFTWKIFSFLNKKEIIPQTQLINKEITKENEKQPMSVIQLPKEKLNSDIVVPPINENKEIAPVMENKAIQPKKSLEKQISLNNSSEIDCGRGKDNGLGNSQPEIDCFFTNMISCSNSKIILGKEAGYADDIFISVNKSNNSCFIKAESKDNIITCENLMTKSDQEIKEIIENSKQASQEDRFLTVFGIPIVLGDKIITGDDSCTNVKK